MRCPVELPGTPLRRSGGLLRSIEWLIFDGSIQDQIAVRTSEEALDVLLEGQVRGFFARHVRAA